MLVVCYETVEVAGGEHRISSLEREVATWKSTMRLR